MSRRSDRSFAASAGIGAIPKGQTDAALSLGMSRGQALRQIVLPQAARIAVPGMTNDFIALFKDSSLVSVIAMMELTKTYNILATTTLRFPGTRREGDRFASRRFPSLRFP